MSISGPYLMKVLHTQGVRTSMSSGVEICPAGDAVPRCFSYGSYTMTAIPVKRDKLPSIAYSEELIFSLSVTLQSTDRRHGIVGQERCHFQRDS